MAQTGVHVAAHAVEYVVKCAVGGAVGHAVGHAVGRAVGNAVVHKQAVAVGDSGAAVAEGRDKVGRLHPLYYHAHLPFLRRRHPLLSPLGFHPLDCLVARHAVGGLRLQQGVGVSGLAVGAAVCICMAACCVFFSTVADNLPCFAIRFFLLVYGPVGAELIPNTSLSARQMSIKSRMCRDLRGLIRY